MGTRGFIVVKFEGKYYRIYNHYDSYPEGLGVEVANVARQAERTKEYVNKVIDKFDSSHYHLLVTESASDVENDLLIEWVYIIDLDAGTFTVNGGYHTPVYQLTSIPDDWLNKFQEEEQKAICEAFSEKNQLARQSMYEAGDSSIGQ